MSRNKYGPTYGFPAKDKELDEKDVPISKRNKMVKIIGPIFGEYLFTNAKEAAAELGVNVNKIYWWLREAKSKTDLCQFEWVE